MSAGRYTVTVSGGRYRVPTRVAEAVTFDEAKATADREAVAYLGGGPRPRVQVLGHANGAPVLVVHDWAEFRVLEAEVGRGPLLRFWVVVKPTALSTLADTLVETTGSGLARMFAGGLDGARIELFAHYPDAHAEALRLLAARGKE